MVSAPLNSSSHLKKARLLFILYDRPNYPGGPIINYLRLLPVLIEQGYEVHVLVMYNSDFPNARELKGKGVHIHVTPFIVDSRKAVTWILKQVENIQPDVFIPDVSTPGCFAGKWVKASGIPVINSHRSDDENNWGKAVYFSDERYGFSTSAIFCVSNYLLERLVQKVKNPNLLTAVIPSGVQIPQNYSQQRDPLSIVYVGRLIQKQKRIFDIVHVFTKLASKFENIAFTFVGDGPDRNQCEEVIVRSGFMARFKFTGMLKGDAYKNELAKHDIVVLLSEYEGVPGSLMDSMASGLVPICYHYPGVDELVLDGQTGFLVTDRQDSVVKIVSLLATETSLRKRISQNARQHIIEHFSIESSLNKWNILIKSLIEQNRDCKVPFAVPSEIVLPPMNSLLKEHIIENKPSVIQRMRSIIGFLTMKIFNISRENEFDNFVTIPFSHTNLDRYFVRRSIILALEWALTRFKGRLLDAGCGKMPYKEYILKNSAVEEYVGLDIETALIYDENIKPDYTWDGKTMPFKDESFDSCIAVEVLEHCPEPEIFLKEVYRVLKPESVFFFTVPFLWNLHEVPHDEYRYTPFALERHLKNSGFNEIDIKAAGGWHAALAQMLGLWVRRSPMSEGKRRILSIILKPFIRFLVKKDKNFIVNFSESQMITSLYGTAKK